MEFSNDVYDSITRYFSILSHTGYKSYSHVDKLLIMIFIEELLYGPMSQFITEDDYSSIIEALYCLYGSSCMIPFPDYKRSIDTIVPRLLSEQRITEDGILRSTESLELRTKS